MSVGITLDRRNVGAVRKNNKGLVLGVLKERSDDESFQFNPVKNIRYGDKYCDEWHYSVVKGAIAGYYMRRFEPGHWPDPQLKFKEVDGRVAGLKVYPNDTYTSYQSGLKYSNSLVFPMKHSKKGVREFLTLIKDTSEAGIIKELDSKEFEELVDYIAYDLHTGEHTKDAFELSQELDVAFM